MTVHIVVLHYKNIKDTIDCLESVSQLNRENFLMKVILVANDSKVKSQKSKVKNTIKNLKIIENEKNLGFAAGVNVGIREALKDKKTDYILILNNDTILSPNLLVQLLKKPIDIASPVIKFKWKNHWVYDYGGRINWWTGRTKHIESSKFKVQSSKFIGNIDYVSGCCMLVRREVFEKIGLFDEDYFFYYEDTDFCTRAKKAGFQIKVNPRVVIYHKLSGSIGHSSSKAIAYNLWGSFIFITKHFGWRRPAGYLYLFALTGKIIIDRILGRQGI